MLPPPRCLCLSERDVVVTIISICCFPYCTLLLRGSHDRCHTQTRAKRMTTIISITVIVISTDPLLLSESVRAPEPVD